MPTEAEWEYACRGGATAFRTFHYGNSLSSSQANFLDRFPVKGNKGYYLARTCKVGSYRPNAFGLYDMHGNVSEWCLDWYDKDYYPAGGTRDPSGPREGSYRVIRGGSWNNPAGFCRAANRAYFSPGYRIGDTGFRVALVPAK